MAIEPVTREERFLAAAGGRSVTPPAPITRKEQLLQGIIDAVKSGGATPDVIKGAVNDYLNANPVQPGATTEQAAQIEQNKNDIADLQTEVDELKESGGNGSGQKQDYAALNNKPRINGVELSGNKTAAELGVEGATDEQVQTAVEQYFFDNPDAIPGEFDFDPYKGYFPEYGPLSNTAKIAAYPSISSEGHLAHEASMAPFGKCIYATWVENTAKSGQGDVPTTQGDGQTRIMLKPIGAYYGEPQTKNGFDTAPIALVSMGDETADGGTLPGGAGYAQIVPKSSGDSSGVSGYVCGATATDWQGNVLKPFSIAITDASSVNNLAGAVTWEYTAGLPTYWTLDVDGEVGAFDFSRLDLTGWIHASNQISWNGDAYYLPQVVEGGCLILKSTDMVNWSVVARIDLPGNPYLEAALMRMQVGWMLAVRQPDADKGIIVAALRTSDWSVEGTMIVKGESTRPWFLEGVYYGKLQNNAATPGYVPLMYSYSGREKCRISMVSPVLKRNDVLMEWGTYATNYAATLRQTGISGMGTPYLIGTNGYARGKKGVSLAKLSDVPMAMGGQQLGITPELLAIGE